VGTERHKRIQPEDGMNEFRNVAEEEKIDLLILPTHEESRLEHFLFGRINEAITRGLPCSILLLKQEAIA
jgi:nucleotide-binding universal stress UspA family protein